MDRIFSCLLRAFKPKAATGMKGDQEACRKRAGGLHGSSDLP